MVSTRLKYIQVLFFLTLVFISAGAYPQASHTDTAYYDTTEYISNLYRGAIDYNLMIAAEKGYTREIDRLIMQGADIFAETNKGVTPLIFAVSNNQTEAAQKLIDYGSDPNKMTSLQETPLMIAVKNRNSEIAEDLIRAGADINACNKYNATALHYASVYGYFQIVDMLLYYEASIDRKTIEGSTPLFAAVWAGNADVTDLLIQNGANMETREKEGFTPFLMAALNGDTLIMHLLYKKGVDIYATTASKHNALDLSIISDQSEATKFLLKIGDKWTNQENNAVSPYKVASEYRRKDMLRILGENKIPGNLKYEINQVDIMASTMFFLHDFYTGASLSFKEPYLNAGIIAGFDTKLIYTRVLLKQSEHTFYQYMDKGSVVYAGLFKDFSFTNNPFRANYEFSTSLAAGYSFGNELKGTLYAPKNKFMVIPAISFKWVKKDLSFSLGADYMNTEFYHVGPVCLRFGVSYNIFIDNVRTKGKTLKWY
jgi:ankyrin repeat protein